MSDIWYLNDSDLMLQPAIVIGEPGACPRHWASRCRPLAFEDSAPDPHGPRGGVSGACMWGVHHARVEVATDHFERRYLNSAGVRRRDLNPMIRHRSSLGSSLGSAAPAAGEQRGFCRPDEGGISIDRVVDPDVASGEDIRPVPTTISVLASSVWQEKRPSRHSHSHPARAAKPIAQPQRVISPENLFMSTSL